MAIYTGTTWWIDKGLADVQAQICADRLNAAGIGAGVFTLESQQADLAAWVSSVTNNGSLVVLVLYGCFPRSIYPTGNTQPDGSIAELFIESPDGDVILNHGDWMFYVDYDAVDTRLENGAGGLQNMMDIPGIAMWGDNTPMAVTPEGAAIAPDLENFFSDRPFHPLSSCRSIRGW